MTTDELWQLAAGLRQYIDEEAAAENRDDAERVRTSVLYLHMLREAQDAAVAEAAAPDAL